VAKQNPQVRGQPRCYNRTMVARLLLISWMVSVLYSSIPLFWFAIHPFAGSWRRMNRSPYRLLLPIWIVIISLLSRATWPWHSMQVYSSLWAWIPAALFFLFGFRTYAGIRSEFGMRKLSGEAELRPLQHQQRLVTSGLHARMRHPIYVAHLFNLAGWAIGSGLVVSYLLLAVSVLITFPFMIWMEERELSARFGANYGDYRRTVPLVPGFSFVLHQKDGKMKQAATRTEIP
jgi:protein-S-isoprenylcysteine O-methyltransferase Ste14